MSDTPETNAAAFDAFDGQGGEVVFADFAKKLERERNSLQDQRDFCMGEIERLRKERDEAREALALATSELAEQTFKLRQQLGKAREALRDMLSGWKYIRSVHGDLYGVGWDRAQSKAETALEDAK